MYNCCQATCWITNFKHQDLQKQPQNLTRFGQTKAVLQALSFTSLSIPWFSYGRAFLPFALNKGLLYRDTLLGLSANIRGEVKAAYGADHMWWASRRFRDGEASEVMDTTQVAEGLIPLSAKHHLQRAGCLQYPPKPSWLCQSRQGRFRQGKSCRGPGLPQPHKWELKELNFKSENIGSCACHGIGTYAFKSPGFSKNLLCVKLHAVLGKGCSGLTVTSMTWNQSCVTCWYLATTWFSFFFFFPFLKFTFTNNLIL